jgi:hypothetical protein
MGHYLDIGIWSLEFRLFRIAVALSNMVKDD